LIDFEEGYQGRLKKQNSENSRLQKLESEQSAMARKTLRLTVAGSIFAVLVLVISLLQYLLDLKEEYPDFPCWECLF